MKRNFKKVAALLTSVLTFIAAIPATVQAAPPPSINSWIWSYDECQNGNLSEGTISWNDDLVNGTLTVKEIDSNNDDWQFQIYSEEFYHISDMPDMNKKQLAKRTAQLAFMPVRTAAQNKGWWDCRWKIKSLSKTKVVAEAVVQYKAVQTDVKSRDVKIKQVTEKKKGKWKTTFKVGSKSYSPNKIKAVFN